MLRAAAGLRWACACAGCCRWADKITGKVLPTDTPHHAYTLIEPLGVVAAVSAGLSGVVSAFWGCSCCSHATLSNSQAAVSAIMVNSTMIGPALPMAVCHC